MRIACGGTTTAIHTHYELVVLGPTPFRMALARPQYWTRSIGGPEELQPVFEHAQLTLSPSGTRIGVWFDGGLAVIDVATRSASRSTAQAFTFVTDELLLSLRTTGNVVGLHRGRHGVVPEPIALSSPHPVAWPVGDGRLWSSIAPTSDAALSRDALMFSNEHGHIVVDSDAGVIVRLGTTDSEPTVYRVPSEGAHSEVRLTAHATAAGFLVAHNGGRSAGVVNHFAVDGRHLGSVAVSGNVSDIGVAASSAIFAREKADFSGGLEVDVASLPSLTITDIVPTTVSTYDGYPGLAVRDDGRELWVGNGGRVETLVCTSRGWDTTSVDLNLPLVTPTIVSARHRTT